MLWGHVASKCIRHAAIGGLPMPREICLGQLAVRIGGDERRRTVTATSVENAASVVQLLQGARP
jgi:hypothetical protein